jgi:hypothetical protein
MNIELSSMSMPSVCKLPAWITAASTLDAIRLIELGARAGTVCLLTGIDKTNANRLYRQIHQRPSPPGQTPFTDSWYLKSDYRMLHASLAWRLFQRYEQPGNRLARMMIEVYECYVFLVQAPLLDVTHLAFVPQLMQMRIWKECVCQSCHTRYVSPQDSNGTICPGCRLYRKFRCSACGAFMGGYRKGRRKSSCSTCGEIQFQ